MKRLMVGLLHNEHGFVPMTVCDTWQDLPSLLLILSKEAERRGDGWFPTMIMNSEADNLLERIKLKARNQKYLDK